MTEQIDYSKIKLQLLQDWRHLYSHSLSYPDNILTLLQKVVDLPYPSQYKLIASYALTPSALANILPLLIFYGQRGTGKSSTGQFISYVHGVSINSGADTFAALRNTLNERRWGKIRIPSDDPTFPGYRIKEIELNTMMVWDDIDTKKLIEEPNIYRMLKSGYNKATDTISIADNNGKNIAFNCFSPKICSTTTPIWGDARFAELERRILVVKFGKAARLNLLRLEDYDWSGFDALFKKHWNNVENLDKWIKCRQIIARKFSNNTRNTVTLDIAATGLSCGFWGTLQELYNYFEEYWTWYDSEAANGESALCGLLKQLIREHQEETAFKSNVFPSFSPDEISPMTVKRRLTEWQNQGMLEITPTTKIVTETMNYLGWRLIPGKWVRMK